MADPFVDTDVLIRFLTGDDSVKQARAAAMFEMVGTGRLDLAAPVTVIADAVFVLSSPRLYRLPRTEVQSLLAPLIRLPGFGVENKRVVLQALEIYANTNLDFGDAMIVASMRQAGSAVVYSYDADFDRFPDVERREPAS